ncbi:PilW family protein [Billgrantia montanilacus]|uniref:Prepilin-type N-terminal cleavage/methylation domain-containing protein n=1 Tax=Billgrantia montanilacus TaxID=2282305 RepID=A0A368TQY5_9GAMM|nr:prepilin-type N-terminal cleavage/methylation domain-containing protein [Halomonas montanilacus]RCV87020.1 prepilin-type N-terminal cleavage/methylation domain-containing protein [Halomonas montanilacus]
MNRRHGPSVFPSLDGVLLSRHQRGFSLIELMVALVIGLIIILGAGQLFLMGFQTFRQTELMGNKQAALTFATEMLIRDIRRANTINDDSVFNLVVPNNGDLASCGSGANVTKEYWVEEFNGENTLMLKVGCPTVPEFTEPLVGGFVSGGFPMPSSLGDGVWELVFRLESGVADNPDEFTFHAVNRNAAVN